tara:strand:- start:10131 stop:10973 length:843 start_codon:yes stop_codon:yes gene_type:complete
MNNTIKSLLGIITAGIATAGAVYIINQSETKPYTPCSPGECVEYANQLQLKIINDPELIGKGKPFYDPNKSGTPLVKVTEDTLNSNVSNYFKLKEFARIPSPQKISEHKFQAKDGNWYFTHIRLSKNLLQHLDNFRERIDSEVKIMSGYRNNDYNPKVGGKSLSRHLSGDGVDIDVDFCQYSTWLQRTYDGIGMGRNITSFTHVDTRTLGENPKARPNNLWGYKDFHKKSCWNQAWSLEKRNQEREEFERNLGLQHVKHLQKHVYNYPKSDLQLPQQKHL